MIYCDKVAASSEVTQAAASGGGGSLVAIPAGFGPKLSNLQFYCEHLR